MRCETFQERLNQLLDERRLPDSDSELTRHTADCSCCAEILRVSECMVDAIEQSRRPFTPRLAVVPPEPGASSRQKLMGAVAVAATLLVAASLWLGQINAEHALPVTTINPTVATNTTTIVTAEMMSDSPPVTFVHQPIIGLSLLSRADWIQAIDEFNMPFGAQASNVDASWLKAVSDGVIPVQQSVNSTFERVRRSVSQVVVSG